ncbi:MAG: helix-hairpin-helix domain-containing protein [Deltaproteobacteria bacterium]|nr:helix-hairpin-helix domain-containing protein [Deltaproteobacteria bacterium]
MTQKTKHDSLIGPLLLLLLILALHRMPGKPDGFGSGKQAPRETVLVQIAGDVARPGVYAFSHPPDLDRSIRRAGGPTGTSVEGAHWREGPIHSGWRIDLVSGQGKPVPAVTEMPAFYKVTLGIPVALNRETRDGLTAIPGIGAKTAEAIVMQRSSVGGFERLDQLLAVEGIGRARMEKIKPYVTLAPGGP